MFIKLYKLLSQEQENINAADERTNTIVQTFKRYVKRLIFTQIK